MDGNATKAYARAQRLIDAMPPGAAAAFGKGKLNVSDLCHIAPPTRTMVQAKGVYVIRVWYQKWAWEALSGGGTREEGGGWRLLIDHGRALRGGTKGEFDTQSSCIMPASSSLRFADVF